MEIYIVQEFSRSDYDFSIDIEHHGAYVSQDEAIDKAKKIFEKLKQSYEEEINKYTPKEDTDYDEDDDEDFEYFDEDGEVEFYIEDDKGFYAFSFGSEEDYELHEVKVVKCVLHQ